MKIHKTHLLFAFIVLFQVFTSCDRPEQFRTGPITVMPLGDSRVSGNRPAFESYRYQLWKLFTQDNWGVDFVGSQKDEAEYPTDINLLFDRDHEGTGGARSSDILKTVNSQTMTDVPEVVLLGIGGNDLSNGGETVMTVSENISMIIDILRSNNPSVTIFLEKIAPGRSDFMTEERWEVFFEFQNAIESLAAAKSLSSSKVVVVDMSDSWSDDYMADIVHYNDEGAAFIAQRYYQSIIDHVVR